MADEEGNMATTLIVGGSLIFGGLIVTAILTLSDKIVKCAEQATNIVKNYVEEQKQKENARNHTVYQLRNKISKEIVYVGRTTNPKTRENAHKKTKPGNDFEVIASNLTKEEARGMEQYYIIKYNTKNSLNKINGISPHNINVGKYMYEGGKAIVRSFGNILEDEVLYWYLK